jgi:aspartate aminotransferase
MSKYLSNRINNLEESPTLAMAKVSRELKAQGKDIISLSLGEPDFDTPEFIKEAAKKAIDDNITHYPPVAGYPELLTAIAGKFKRDNNLSYEKNQIVVSTGAKQSIINVVLSLVNPGEEVLIPCPYWVSYDAAVYMAEGKSVFVKTGIENDFKMTPEQLEANITDKTKLIIFSTPCNPSGAMYSKDELKGLADVIAKHPGVFVICDEIYEHINFVGKHESLAQYSNVYDQTITVNGVAKGYAMTGWRIGFIGAPAWIAKACEKLQGQFTSGASSISQMATVAAMNADPSATHLMRDTFLKRRDLVLGLLADIPGLKTRTPEGAFYLFPDVSAFFGKTFEGKNIKNASDLSIFLLEQANIAVVTGEAFGDENCIRFSYAAADDILIEAVKRMKAALEMLK